jgi:uncharacterized membrane protein YiaA
MSYGEAEKGVSRIFIWFFICLLVGIAICFIGFMIADTLLPYGQYWAFIIMFIFGALFCRINIFIKAERK